MLIHFEFDEKINTLVSRYDSGFSYLDLTAQKQIMVYYYFTGEVLSEQLLAWFIEAKNKRCIITHLSKFLDVAEFQISDDEEYEHQSDQRHMILPQSPGAVLYSHVLQILLSCTAERTIPSGHLHGIYQYSSRFKKCVSTGMMPMTGTMFTFNTKHGELARLEES